MQHILKGLTNYAQPGILMYVKQPNKSLFINYVGQATVLFTLFKTLYMFCI